MDSEAEGTVIVLYKTSERLGRTVLRFSSKNSRRANCSTSEKEYISSIVHKVDVVVVGASRNPCRGGPYLGRLGGF
jgi:hypothetical protein